MGFISRNLIEKTLLNDERISKIYGIDHINSFINSTKYHHYKYDLSENNIDSLPLCLLDNLFIHRCNCRRLPYDIHENKQENITKRGKLYMCKFCEWNVNLYHNFIYESNPIHKTIMNQKGKNKFGQKTYIYLERMKKNKPYVLKIEEWFLDCKYNPKYKYCKDRLLKEYKELYEEE